MDRAAKRNKARISVAVAFVLAAAAALSATRACAAMANVDLKPGKYTVTVTFEVQDQRQNESRTATRCIRRRDLHSPENIFNDRTDAQAKEGACSLKNLKSAKGQISYDADCSNRTVHVQGTASGTRFSVVRTVTPKANRGVSLKFTVRGTRTGDCLAAEQH